jgi:hypothetical protein
MNNQFLYEINIEIGQFTLSVDVLDLAFISTEDNKDCVFKIDILLSKDNRFEKFR